MKILMNSLGCDKNLVDAEEMMAFLARDGHSFTEDPAEADLIIVNTCCFIEDAKKESIDALFDAVREKEGRGCAVIATGCMAQRYTEELRSEMPELDAVTGIGSPDRIVRTVRMLSEKKDLPEIAERPGMHAYERILTGGGYTASLRIADGCDKFCSYCVIPRIRGRYRSIPMEELYASAKALAARGVRELCVIAQETTIYGTDLYGRKALPELLHMLCGIDGIEWIRLLYCYPEEIEPELIETMRTEKKIVHYIDMPIQHISDPVLKAMNRRTTGETIRRAIRDLREAMPDIAIRTTLLSGFPGETEAQHEELLAFVRESRFARLGVFSYSREEGTPAYKMKGQIPARTKKRRRDELMLAQQEVSKDYQASRIGRELTVLTDGALPEEGILIGRTYADAPEVDGAVFFRSQREHMSGDFVRVRIEEASEYDLYGEEINESAE